MNAITIHAHLDSDTIRIPELRPMIGKDVEITVRESPSTTPADRSGFFRMVREVAIDFGALDELREASKL
jgi:hypothetical protein